MRLAQKLSQKAKKIPGVVYPLVFFFFLVASRLSSPDILIFDEIHYVPAAKSLINSVDNLNWVHPPLGKFILGLFWLIFTKILGLMGEPEVFRFATLVFGMWILCSVYQWMRAFGFSKRNAEFSVWLTGFNGLWFVQSKVAMLDVFFVAFGVAGLYQIFRKKNVLGWALLGLSVACKWSGFVFLILVPLVSKSSLRKQALASGVALVAYSCTFLPLAFLSKHAVPFSEIFSLHSKMLAGFSSLSSAPHPYGSSWWQWPTLWRPMWYALETSGNVEQAVWGGGNPVLFWVALPVLVWSLWLAFERKDAVLRVLSFLYWIPLLVWAFVPRRAQHFYYYLPASIWVGPIVVWMHEHIWVQHRKNRTAPRPRLLLLGFTFLCALGFFYFLPIMDGRALPAGRFRLYMWLQSWI